MSTGYRPPSKEPIGAWARHLHAYRRTHEWSQTRAFEEWREGLGLGPRSRASYIALDMGIRQPKPHEADYLASVLGEPAEVAPEPAEGPQAPDALVQALSAQTKAISELAAALRDDSLEVRLRVLEALVLPREQPADEGSQEQSVPHVTAG